MWLFISHAAHIFDNKEPKPLRRGPQPAHHRSQALAKQHLDDAESPVDAAPNERTENYDVEDALH